MKIETLLDALEKVVITPGSWHIRYRQHLAFRNRILRMYRERDSQAAKSFDLWTTERGIANDLRRQLKAKDQRIAELENELKEVKKACPDYQLRMNEREYQRKLKEKKIP